MTISAALATAGLAACAAAFDPTGPCTADGSAAGAYPTLEARVPRLFRGSAPRLVDSGRTCTKDGLGTLTAHGVAELRFAGATWETGNDSGLSLAVFTDDKASQLDPAWMTEFYEQGARTGKNVESVNVTSYDVADGITGQRIDVLNGESFQTVVIWPREGVVVAVLVADFIREIQTKEAHDRVVREAVDAWGDAGGGIKPLPPETPATTVSPASAAPTS